jgi:hypothetical protein
VNKRPPRGAVPTRLAALTHMAPEPRRPALVLPLRGTGSVAEREGVFRW